MTSIRLTVGMKEQIERRLVHYRFEEEAQQIVADYSQLAADVYDDLYDQLTQRKMGTLPDGWLPSSSQLKVQFGGDYTQLDFGGKCYGDIAYANGRPGAERGMTRLFPSCDKDKTLRVYEATHPLAMRYDALENRYHELEGCVRAAKKVARAAMDSVTTLARLEEVWPEVAPFTEGFKEQPSNLPTISRADLNEVLGLPKEEAA